MLRDCPNYRCRRRVDRLRILALPADWRSVVCPHCATILALVYVGGLSLPAAVPASAAAQTA